MKQSIVPAVLRRQVFVRAAALALLAGCAPRSPLKIGFVAGLSGRAADVGISERNGAQLAVDDVAAAGGFDGRPVQLLIRDDEQKPESTARAVAELADAGVEFVIGPMTSSTAVAGALVANQRRLVMISPAGTTHELSGHADYFFRCVADAPAAARQLGDFLFERGGRVLAVLGDTNNRPFADSFSKAIEARFVERGGRLAVDSVFRSGADATFSQIAAGLLATHPDTVVVIAGAVDAALVVQHLRQRDHDVMVALTPWAGTEELIQLGGRAIDGTYVPQYFDRDSQAQPYLQFVRRYRSRFGDDPGFPATIAYDAVTMGLAALHDRQRGQTLRDALGARSEYPGLQRPTRIDRFGDGAGPLTMTVVRDGRYQTVPR